MPDTFVHFRGIKNTAFRDDKPEYWSQKFVVHHDTPEDFKKVFNSAMQDIFQMQGMIVLKNELDKNDFENLMFVPMHMIARIEYETKQLTTPYIIDEDARKQ